MTCLDELDEVRSLEKDFRIQTVGLTVREEIAVIAIEIKPQEKK